MQKKNDKLHFNDADTVCLIVYTYQDLLKKVLSTAQTLKVNGFPHQTLVVMTAQAKHDPFQIRQVNWMGIEFQTCIKNTNNDVCSKNNITCKWCDN